jgi:hypothetical protein
MSISACLVRRKVKSFVFQPLQTLIRFIVYFPFFRERQDKMASTNDLTEPPTMQEKDEVVTGAQNDGSLEQVDNKSTFGKKLALKIDLYLLTPMLFLNFLSLMGRTNIGAALIQGLPKDLKLTAIKVFLAISISLVPLILFEIPRNLLQLLIHEISLSHHRFSW